MPTRPSFVAIFPSVMTPTEERLVSCALQKSVTPYILTYSAMRQATLLLTEVVM